MSREFTIRCLIQHQSLLLYKYYIPISSAYYWLVCSSKIFLNIDAHPALLHFSSSFLNNLFSLPVMSPQNLQSHWNPVPRPTLPPRLSWSGNLPMTPTATSLTTWSSASVSLKPLSSTSTTTVRRVSHGVCTVHMSAPGFGVVFFFVVSGFVCQWQSNRICLQISISKRAYLTQKLFTTSGFSSLITGRLASVWLQSVWPKN